jgi:predicted Zn-dependent protease
MTMEVSPNFAGVSLLATIRHEFGHALGIWGHSPKSSDALYFSQVSDPPAISVGDINTLKKIYQQPTKLGWRI